MTPKNMQANAAKWQDKFCSFPTQDGVNNSKIQNIPLISNTYIPPEQSMGSSSYRLDQSSWRRS